MSAALYEIGGLRFWDESEIELRELFQQRVVSVVKRTLTELNPAWRYFRMEGPILTPSTHMSRSYDSSDIFAVDFEKGGNPFCLRAETTASSYAFARKIQGKKPICVWQAGKSFRKEENDGASAAKLRFNEFWQLEFQCIYRADTKADYRAALIPPVTAEIARFTGLPTRIAESDRLPSYSQSTLDIEVETARGWREMASCSIRTDYGDDCLVTEIAIGLDRVATLAD